MIGTTFFRTLINIFKEEFEDTKAVIRIRISKKTTHWQKKVQKKNNDLHKTKDRVTRTPFKTGGELWFSGRVSSSCSTIDTRRVDLVTNPVIRHEWGKDREVFTTSGTYLWSSVIHVFHSGQPSHGCDRKAFEMMIST